MVPELRPLVRRLRLARSASAPRLYTGQAGDVAVAAALGGIGTAPAAEATERLLDAWPADLVVVVGIAGAIGPSLALGATIAPERVLDVESGVERRPAALPGVAARGLLATSGRLIVEREELARLERRGVVAIDMETAAVAAVCERCGVPWAAFRAISDRAGDPGVDASILALGGPDGRGDPAAVARYVLARPWRIVLLARLARGMRRATDAAAHAAIDAISAGRPR
jgi:adenosylhomocysteine nucleosidase